MLPTSSSPSADSLVACAPIRVDKSPSSILSEGLLKKIFSWLDWKRWTNNSSDLANVGKVCKSFRQLAFEVLAAKGGVRGLNLASVGKKEGQPLPETHLSSKIIRNISHLDKMFITGIPTVEDLTHLNTSSGLRKVQILCFSTGVDEESGVNFTPDMIQELEKLPRLKTLEFSHPDFDLSTLKPLTTVQELRLTFPVDHGMKETVSQIVKLSQLQKLTLDGGKALTKTMCEKLATLTHLTFLKAEVVNKSEVILSLQGLQTFIQPQGGDWLANYAKMPKLQLVNMYSPNSDMDAHRMLDQIFKFNLPHLYQLKNRDGYVIFLSLCRRFLERPYTHLNVPEIPKPIAHLRKAIIDTFTEKTPPSHEILQALFLMACYAGDEALALHLLTVGAKVNERDHSGKTPLGVALDRYVWLENGRKAPYLPLITLLLDKGADPNQPCAEFSTSSYILPLHQAIFVQSPRLTQELLKAGACSNLGCSSLAITNHIENVSKEVPLPKFSHNPSYVFALVLLIEYLQAKSKKANIDRASSILSQILLQHKKIVHRVDERGNTLMHYVASNKLLWVVPRFAMNLIHFEIDVNFPDKAKNSALYVLLRTETKTPEEEKQQLVVFEYLISVKAKVIKDGEVVSGKKLIELAADCGAREIVKYLKSYEEVDAVAKLQEACKSGKLKSYLEVMGESFKIANFLDVRTEAGNSLLHLAVQSKSASSVNHLLSLNADVQAENKACEKPIDLALALKEKEIVFLLAKHESELRLRNDAQTKT